MTALPVLKRITRCIPGVQYSASLGDVLRIFARHPADQAVVVLNGPAPIGIICRDLVADVVDCRATARGSIASPACSSCRIVPAYCVSMRTLPRRRGCWHPWRIATLPSRWS